MPGSGGQALPPAMPMLRKKLKLCARNKAVERPRAHSVEEYAAHPTDAGRRSGEFPVNAAGKERSGIFVLAVLLWSETDMALLPGGKAELRGSGRILEA